jgi:hypothetical protein
MDSAAVHESWFKQSNTRSKECPIDRMPFVKRSMHKKTILNKTSKVYMQCMQGEDDKFYYVHLDPYDSANFAIMDEVSPLLVNPLPSQFETGAMYTYVIASVIKKNSDTNMDRLVSPMKLYACKTINMFEFGTKHHQIFYRMVHQLNELESDPQLQYALHASGEIHCIDPVTLVFNYISGTYKMKRKIPMRRTKYEAAIVRRLMHKITPDYQIDFDFKPFIVPETMRITHAEIARLKSNGIMVFPFSAQRQCREMRFAVMGHKKHMPPDEMIQTYKKITNDGLNDLTPTACIIQ